MTVIFLFSILLHTVPNIYTTSYSPFEEAIKNPAFVDKTKFIASFVSRAYWDKHPNHFVVTAPRKFGKSVYADMFKRFTELKFDTITGKKIPKNDTDNYQLFYNNTLHLTITRDKFFYDELFGEFAVIHLKYTDVQNATYDKIVQNLRQAVRQSLLTFQPLYDRLDRKNRTRFLEQRKIINKILNNESMTDESLLINGLSSLAILLRNYTCKQVILIIEDYDKPMSNALYDGVPLFDLYRLIDHMYFAILGFDTVVRHALIIGSSSISIAESSSDIYCLGIHKFLDDHVLSEFFGFTNPEVHQLYTKFNLPNDEIKYIKQYYGNYNVRKTMQVLYNPWDILQYLEHREIKNYWIDTNTIYPFKNTADLNITAKLQTLISKKRCQFYYWLEHEVRISDLEYFQHFLINGNTTPIARTKDDDWLAHLTDDKVHHNDQLLALYLVESGYLSHAKKIGIMKSPNEMTENEIRKLIPDLLLGNRSSNA